MRYVLSLILLLGFASTALADEYDQYGNVVTTLDTSTMPAQPKPFYPIPGQCNILEKPIIYHPGCHYICLNGSWQELCQ